ncbi:MAG: hypothetical protein CSA95_04790 [Bacteroidetes bacterium]|nr:MAG: hypothetical protein CSA95_04790 [Bacteroidota bacterium]PIE88689.1 MAG: hypothetical protein CSA04_00600 [Bacteroidota bacterium]
MKKLLYLLAIISLFSACNSNKKRTTIDEHSAENALDYEGVYKGTYPCADCSGIEASLTLNTDKTFVYEILYMGEKDGRFVYKGHYTVNKNIATIQVDGRPVHFFVGESALILLGEDLKPNTGELAHYYQLKKQRTFHYEGEYETFNEEKGGYTQTLSIHPKGADYEVIFSASKVKERENCRFSGIANLKKDTLWVNISNEADKEVRMYIAPSHDNLGVEVFTSNFDERFYMMRYCGGGSSLAGKYLKNRITANSIGVFNAQQTIAEVLHTLPDTQTQKKEGKGEFAEDQYDDYEIYTRNNQLLFTLTPKDTGDIYQKINRVWINSPSFRTEKGINTSSTYGDLKKAYTISNIVPTREHIVFEVEELNASFSIAKSKLKKGWWDDQAKKVNEHKIPTNAPIDHFILWWKEE